MRVVASSADPLVRIADAEVRFPDLAIDVESFGHGLSFPTIAFAQQLSGALEAVVVLEVWANGQLVTVEEVTVVGVSSRPVLHQVTVLDDEGGNGDGRAQAGEIIRIELVLALPAIVATRTLGFRLRELGVELSRLKRTDSVWRRSTPRMACGRRDPRNSSSPATRRRDPGCALSCR